MEEIGFSAMRYTIFASIERVSGGWMQEQIDSVGWILPRRLGQIGRLLADSAPPLAIAFARRSWWAAAAVVIALLTWPVGSQYPVRGMSPEESAERARR